MRVSSPVLYDLARSNPEAEPGPEERRVVIPPVIQPYVCLQHANRNIAFDAVTVFRASFVQEAEDFQNGVDVGATTVICRFAQGLWEVWASLTSVTDLAEAITIDPRAALILIDPLGGAARLLSVLAGTGQQDRWGRWWWLFPDDGWNMAMTTEATVAGQERYSIACVSGRLLV